MNYASILVVDDDEMIVHFFKVILEEVGYAVTAAYTGVEAIENIKKKKFDAAILDYKLSDTTGDKLAERLREQNKRIKIIFVTGYSEVKERVLTDRLADQVIVKPIRDDKLIEIVEQVLHEETIELKSSGAR